MNSTGESLNLNDNPLARALLAKAGQQLQTECTKLAPLQEGEVKETETYGSLACKKMLHCRVAGHYNGPQSEPVGALCVY